MIVRTYNLSLVILATYIFLFIGHVVLALSI